MQEWSRRETAFGGALTLIFGLSGSCSCAHADDARGCFLSDASFERLAPAGADVRTFISGSEPMIHRSGDRNFDFALVQTLSRLSIAFEVLPGFAYYDDASSRNAYATTRTRLQRADGTFLFGLELLRSLMARREHPDVAVAAVCAHEFGHILQFKRGLIPIVNAGQATVKRSELQADYFAGYFSGLRRLERPGFPSSVFISTQSSLGDYSIEDRQHHGTPRERGAAVLRGFEAAFREKKSLAEAIAESTVYVMRL